MNPDPDDIGIARREVSGLDTRSGARNLLRNCVGARRGESLLIIGEKHGVGYYDDRLCEFIAHEARTLGIEARILRTRPASGPDDIPDSVSAAMRAVDHTVFLARLGDQIRFTETDGDCSKTMCYTLDMEYLGSDFARVPWGLFQEVHDRLLAAIVSADRYRITCPLGTDLEGDIAHARENGAAVAVTDFTMKLFPVVIIPPINCVNVSGRLVFDRFLMSTSINCFDNAVVPLDHPVIANIEQCRIVGFEGDPTTVSKVERQYRRVGGFTGGDPYAVNSWHTGIYPKTFYSMNPSKNIQRWGDLIFSSPRYTHFHTCGPSPGNIASATFDATIAFDSEVFWDSGRPAFLDRPDMQALLDRYPGADGAYAMRWDIGL